MNTVTLGGERLGAGKKQKVDLHGFERSTHDLSYTWRSTMAAGTLVPFLSEVALPGDTIDIDLNMDGKTHPTIGPLFGSYKAQLDVFAVPMRLYHSALHNNMLGIGLNMSAIKLPKFTLAAKSVTDEVTDMDNFQVNPSSIFSYLGIRGVGVPGVMGETDVVERSFNAIPYLAYWEIYKQYYSNKQEEEGVVIHTEVTLSPWLEGNEITIYRNGEEFNIGLVPTFAIQAIGTIYATIASGEEFNPNTVLVYFTDGGTATLDQLTGGFWVVDSATIRSGTILAQWANKTIQRINYLTPQQTAMFPITLERFPLDSIDNMRQYILASPPLDQVIVNNASLQPYNLALSKSGSTSENVITCCAFTQEGLGVKTYQSDLFNNWLSTDWIDGVGGINEITAVDTSSGSFNIDALNLSKKVYDMLNRIAVSGGTYDDWLSAVYDHDSYTRAESPVYLGGLIKELVFQEVVSNSQNENQPLGTLAGKGVMSNKHKGGKVVVRVDEPSYIMGIISLTPRLDYSQGNKWDVHLDSLDDLHKPNLDQIGFQELITEQMAWWSTSKNGSGSLWTQKSAGKQPAWINYMTNVNRVLGNFAIADNEMFMTLNRKYEWESVSGYNNLGIGDLTTYIDPSKFNHIFAETSLDSQNFWVQISVDMIARRKMSAKVMPNL